MVDVGDQSHIRFCCFFGRQRVEEGMAMYFENIKEINFCLFYARMDL